MVKAADYSNQYVTKSFRKAHNKTSIKGSDVKAEQSPKTVKEKIGFGSVKSLKAVSPKR